MGSAGDSGDGRVTADVHDTVVTQRVTPAGPPLARSVVQ